MKKRVILYGVGSIELRKDAEFFMDDDYEIIGYSDTYFTCDVLDHKPFYLPDELCRLEFDFIVLLAYQEKSLSAMKHFLVEKDIPAQKILAPVIFLHHNTEKYQLDVIQDILDNYGGGISWNGLVFGLSYSLCGIQTEAMTVPFYNCSWSSLDLYYNFRIFEYMQTHQLLSHVKTALLMFPYYYFDYDMSRFLHLYQNGHIFSVRQLDDWHHYKDVAGAAEYVENYRIFGSKIAKFYSFQRFGHQSQRVYEGEDASADLNPIWFRHYEETAAENIDLLAAFIRQLRSNAICPALIIPPFYLKGLHPTSQEAFRNKKQDFYRLLHKAFQQSEAIPVWDFSQLFAERREYFMDTTHLNSSGAKRLTEILDERLCRPLASPNPNT